MRKVTFNLISVRNPNNGKHGPVDEEELDAIRSEMMSLYNGREAELQLPGDTDHHFVGYFQLGERSGYHTNRIPVTVDVYPYKLANAQTVVTRSCTANRATQIQLDNEQGYIVPEVTLTGTNWTITDGTNTRTIATPGTYTFSELKLKPGANTWTCTCQSGGTITIRYTKRKL